MRTINNRVMTDYRNIIDNDGSKRGKRKKSDGNERVGEAKGGSERRAKLKQHYHRRWSSLTEGHYGEASRKSEQVLAMTLISMMMISSISR